MKIERIVGLKKAGIRRTPRVPSRPLVPLPEITTPTDKRGPQEPSARPEKKPVRISSFLAISVTATALLFGFFLLGDRGFLEVRNQRQRLAGLQTEVAALYAENGRIEAEIARLKDDPTACEKIAREELNFAKQDEVVLLLPKGWLQHPPATSAASATPVTSATPVAPVAPALEVAKEGTPGTSQAQSPPAERPPSDTSSERP